MLAASSTGVAAEAEQTEALRRAGQAGHRQPSVGILFYYASAEKLAAALKELLPDIKLDFVLSGLNGLTDADRLALQSLDVLITQPNMMRQFGLIYDMPLLKWMHCVTTGVDEIMKDIRPKTEKPFPSYYLTRNAGYFGLQMAEYVIGIIIARERFFRELEQSQQNRIWMESFEFRQPCDRILGICGFGYIGKEVARVAKVFGMKVLALVRTLPEESNECHEMEDYRLTTKLDELLSSSDYILSLLPSIHSTDAFFDGDVLSKCKTKKPVFINSGRGNCISEGSILRALDEGWISHAVLDVFKEEPLAADSPLWSHPKVTITPHVSAICVREKQFLKTFVENYDRFLQSETLLYTVDWNKGY